MQESDGADGRHNRKQATPPEGNSRRGGFSLSVGKHVVKGVRRRTECLDLCCKYTCLRHIWQYAGGIIHRDLGCDQLRWQRQRIPSRICLLEIKLTLQKYYFGLNLVSPQKLLHSRNLSGILRESMFEIRESTRSYEQVLFILPYPKKYCFISEVPPSLSQNHS